MGYDYNSRRKLENDYFAKWESDNRKIIQRSDKELYDKIIQLGSHSAGKDPYFTEMIKKDCRAGLYRSPSDFMKKHMGSLIRAFVPENSLADYYSIVDELPSFQYTIGFSRRSFRTKDFSVHVCHAVKLMYTYMAFGIYGVSMADYLRDAMSEEKLDYKRNHEDIYEGATYFYLDDMIAARINAGDQAVIDAIQEAILSENNTVIVSRAMISAIIKCKNQELHQLLGKFLVAARLSEGVRQVICENMDQGRVDSFITLLRVIDRENLVRFAAVKRAFAVWTGFLDETNIDHLINKAMPIMLSAIENADYARELLRTDDSMKIMLGLWALASREVEDAIHEMKIIAESGTRQQKLTISLFNGMLQNPASQREIAAYVVEHNPDDIEMIGAFMDTYLSNAYGLAAGSFKQKDRGPHDPYTEDADYDYFKIPLNRLFEGDTEVKPDMAVKRDTDVKPDMTVKPDMAVKRDTDVKPDTVLKRNIYVKKVTDDESVQAGSRARRHYEILKVNHDQLSKKSLKISPFVFPWLSLTIRKSDFIERMSLIAYALEDQTLIDETCRMLDEIECTYLYSSSRKTYLRVLLHAPATEIQRKVLVNAVCDKESGTRKVAFSLLKRITLRKDEYDVLAGFLKYKNAESRVYILSLLKMQDKKALTENIEMLLKSGNANMRLAGFDLLKTEFQEEQETAEKILKDAGIGDSLSEQEKVLWKEICREQKEENTKENGYGLYNPKVRFEIPPVKNSSEAAISGTMEKSASKAPIPGTSIGTSVKSAMKALFSGSSQDKSALSQDKSVISEDKSVISHDKSALSQDKVGARLVREYFSVTKEELDGAFLALNELMITNGHLEYKSTNGETNLLINGLYLQNGYTWNEPLSDRYPFKDLWTEFYKEMIHSEKLLLAMKLALLPGYNENEVEDYQEYRKREKELLGPVLSGYSLPTMNKGDGERIPNRDLKTVIDIMTDISGARIPQEIAIAACEYMAQLPENDRWFIEPEKNNNTYSIAGRKRKYHAFTDAKNINTFIFRLLAKDCYEQYKDVFFALRRLDIVYAYQKREPDNIYTYNWWDKKNILNFYPFIFACTKGLITKDYLYQYIFEEYPLARAVSELGIFSGAPLSVSEYRTLSEFMKADPQNKTMDADDAFYRLGQEIYNAVTNLILNVELKRGDTETEFSYASRRIDRVYGMERLGQILHALGKDPLDRGTYYFAGNGTGKKECLSHLLQVCYPLEDDVASNFKNIHVTEDRLIEVAMYAPQWLDLIGEYIGYSGLKSGCYYFMAHMNERFDDKKAAIIAKYTPLSIEELNDGAFDLNWFREAYNQLGEKTFGKLYAAAKYISDGSKHARARKYADAALGKVDRDELEPVITEKRNKDLLMSYGIIPVQGEKDSLHRYEFIRKFAKESRQFGAQRRASEQKACQMALKNLATASGYADSLRLTLAMETALIEENESYFDGEIIGDYKIYVKVSDDGKAELCLEKAGKQVKTVPAALKKNETILAMKEFVTKLKDQYARAVKMFENSMEESEEYTAFELLQLCRNPVLKALLTKLIFIKDDDFYIIHPERGFVPALPEEGGAVGGQNVKGQPDFGQPDSGQPDSGQPDSGQPVAGQTVAGQIVAGQTVAGQTVAGQTVAGQTVAGQNVVGQNVVGQSVARQSIAMEPVEAQSVVNQPVAIQSIDGQDQVRFAHPYDMYIHKKWAKLQELVFGWAYSGKKYQPFKQVFRELYLKLPEEAESIYSRMFAGNQIQPKKTVATLKNRKWIADYENGLQKVYYKDNIIATIYAMADWFSPSEIEEPTLEYVSFYDRKTFKAKKNSEIPDILYSEVMRDVDLAVSVAYAGGVDPETSHSTIEMRSMIIEFNLKLFKLANVRLEGSHAFVRGKYGEYSIHLGSGVVHKLPGIAVHVLPVQSQSRGKIFLPFIDQDPKTSEIMSKIILFAEDQKIKDPSILEQIMRG